MLLRLLRRAKLSPKLRKAKLEERLETAEESKDGGEAKLELCNLPCGRRHVLLTS